jgi:DNA-binding response OmpR family regulator
MAHATHLCSTWPTKPRKASHCVDGFARLDTPILVVHPQGELEDLINAFEAGTDAYLSGLVEDSELLSHIGALCRRRAMDGHLRVDQPQRVR